MNWAKRNNIIIDTMKYIINGFLLGFMPIDQFSFFFEARGMKLDSSLQTRYINGQ